MKNARLIVLTGAGLSAESGLRTFRDTGGLWENESIETVCHAETWEQNITAVHRFYNERRAQLRDAQPNAAHRMLADWEARYDTLLLTQNVDDLLERAGCRTVTHLHGCLTQLRCDECGHLWNIGYAEWTLGDPCPQAPACRCVRGIRPNIVFFGEPAPEYAGMWQAFHDLQPHDAVVIIGTSGTVLPVNTMVAGHKARGGLAVLNNLHRQPEITERLFTHVFHEPATQTVEKIDAILRERFAS